MIKRDFVRLVGDREVRRPNAVLVAPLINFITLGILAAFDYRFGLASGENATKFHGVYIFIGFSIIMLNFRMVLGWNDFVSRNINYARSRGISQPRDLLSLATYISYGTCVMVAAIAFLTVYSIFHPEQFARPVH